MVSVGKIRTVRVPFMFAALTMVSVGKIRNESNSPFAVRAYRPRVCRTAPAGRLHVAPVAAPQ
eukprot:1195429-Prorocentrum_minimum.AAC.4